jgi:hypothetical protein
LTGQPRVRMVPEDYARLAISEALIPLQAAIINTAAHHPGRYDDLLDILPLIGRILDSLQWRGIDMVAYFTIQKDVSQEQSATRMTELARAGRWQELADYAAWLARTYPMPLIER